MIWCLLQSRLYNMFGNTSHLPKFVMSIAYKSVTKQQLNGLSLVFRLNKCDPCRQNESQ